MRGMGASPRQWTHYISTQMKLTIRASLQSKAIGIGYIIKRFKIQLEVGYLIQWFWPQCRAPECGVCTLVREAKVRGGEWSSHKLHIWEHLNWPESESAVNSGAGRDYEQQSGLAN